MNQMTTTDAARTGTGTWTIVGGVGTLLVTVAGVATGEVTLYEAVQVLVPVLTAMGALMRLRRAVGR